MVSVSSLSFPKVMDVLVSSCFKQSYQSQYWIKCLDKQENQKIEQPKNEDKNFSQHWVISGYDKLYNTTSGYFAAQRQRESSKLYLPENKAPISNFFQSHRGLLYNWMYYLIKLGMDCHLQLDAG